MKKTKILPTESQVEQFKMLIVLLNSIYDEMKEFSKKKPDEPLNIFKIKNINRVLEQIKDILKNEPTIGFLDLLDNDTLPSNSDAILVIGQFLASMNRFRTKYYSYRENLREYKWSTKENPLN